MVSDSDLSDTLKNLAVRLFEINAYKFGNFQLKSGSFSPVYFDLRVIVSYPDVMETLSNLLVEFTNQKNIPFDHVCGVPYTALPIATLMSVKNNKPMLIRRKETKAYGTKKLIEGKYNSGDNCLIVEDVVTTGSSVLETVKDLRSEGIEVTDAIIVVNREQGGETTILANGVKMHSIFTISLLLNILKEAGKIDDSTVNSVLTYIGSSQIVTSIPEVVDRTKVTFEKRLEHSKSPVAKRLFQIMISKKTNLCVAADLTSSKSVLNVAEAVGPYVAVLKTHVDIIEDFSNDFVNSLTALAKKHNFLIMEDRKFADIGNTVALQYSKGIFNISSWADLVTAHSLPGPSVLKGLKSVLSHHDHRAVFLIGELSAAGNLISEKYTEDTIKISSEGPDSGFVAGVVCQRAGVVSSLGLIQLTPGCKIDDTADNLGQQYSSPEQVMKEKGADLAVVGRGIIEANNIEAMTKVYQKRLWSAYCDRVNIENNN